MFIHRDDADPEKKKRAELIVAKHRNGPTDNDPAGLRALAHAVPQRRPRPAVSAGRRRRSTGAPPTGAASARSHRRLEKRFGPLDPPRPPIRSTSWSSRSSRQHTSDLNADRAFADLRAAFPWRRGRRGAAGATSPTRSAAGGLANTKAPRIQAILREVARPRGRVRPGSMRGDARRRGARLPDRRCPASAPRRRPSCWLRAGARRDPGRHARHRVTRRLGLVPPKATRRARRPAPARPGPRRPAHADARGLHPARPGDLQGARPALPSCAR